MALRLLLLATAPRGPVCEHVGGGNPTVGLRNLTGAGPDDARGRRPVVAMPST